MLSQHLVVEPLDLRVGDSTQDHSLLQQVPNTHVITAAQQRPFVCRIYFQPVPTLTLRAPQVCFCMLST